MQIKETWGNKMDNEKPEKIVKNVLDLVKVSINVKLTSTFFYSTDRGLVHHHHRILKVIMFDKSIAMAGKWKKGKKVVWK